MAGMAGELRRSRLGWARYVRRQLAENVVDAKEERSRQNPIPSQRKWGIDHARSFRWVSYQPVMLFSCAFKEIKTLRVAHPKGP